MTSPFDILLEKVNELHDLQKALMLLSWDREVNMPAGGMPARTQQMTTLSRLIHTLQTSPEMGDLIENAAASLNDAAYDSFAASLIRYLRYDYEINTKLPSEFVARRTQISAQANVAWKAARAQDDFAIFQPWLAQVVALGQEMADLYGYEDEKYDPLLDKFERDAKTAQVRAIFNVVKEATVPLLRAIQEHDKPVNSSILRQPYDVARQKEFAHYIATAVGYDFSRGHLGTATHPFATSFSRDDARITTRWYPDFLNPSLFGTLHESGHAMYEQGTGPELARTPLARGTSSGIHESQSRMIENNIGRSLGFWRVHFPKLQALFPDTLGAVNLTDFYRAINKVQPSTIRVEADELTYNLHIILRFELEQALINGDLAAADVPAAWNDKMQELLGITPPTNREGCLQDIHWSRPSFGYFPTYALGNLYAAQLFAAAQEQNPAIRADVEQGDPISLLQWLRDNVHRHGRKFTPSELVQQATGQPLSHEPFVRYITAKFSDIYEL
ncbi:MAG: carboxypeptidase M32 [Ardenticatenales bacterium]|nr:carboxypeptidase M32 [Ardenticatenales bacterium]